MSTTKTAIVNRALIKFGSRTVTNIDTDTSSQEARIAKIVYPIALEKILTETLWTHSKRRKLLSTLDEDIPFNLPKENLSVVYQKPAGCLRIFALSDTGADWYEEGGKIYADRTGLGAIYSFLNEDPTTYPPYFSTALSDLIAAEICYPLTNSAAKAQELFELFQRVSLPMAMAANAQTGKAMEPNDDYWLNARFGGPNIKEFS